MLDIWIILVAVFMLVGLVGVILPVLPGVLWIFLLALIFGLGTSLATLNLAELSWLGLLLVISFLVDYLSGALGAKFSGASGRSLMFGIVGLLIGTLILPPFGGIIGMFVAILINEFTTKGRIQTAIKAATGGVLGALSGIIINLGIGITMICLFLYFSLN